MEKFVTHDQLEAALSGERARSDALLDDAIARVEGDIRDTETRLRGEWTDALRHEVDKIDKHLDRQDEYIMRKRFVWPKWRRDTSSLLIATLGAMLIAHFFFGVG